MCRTRILLKSKVGCEAGIRKMILVPQHGGAFYAAWPEAKSAQNLTGLWTTPKSLDNAVIFIYSPLCSINPTAANLTLSLAMEGYAKVAGLMGTYPEYSILRRFRALNMQNLLYLQAEITHLEAELRRLAQQDVTSGNKPDHVHDWWTLAHDDELGDAKQWELVLEIREKLEKYSTRQDKFSPWICGQLTSK
jgi:hypothetical protein